MGINIKGKFGSSFLSVLALAFSGITLLTLISNPASESALAAFSFFGSMLPLSLYYAVKAFRKKAMPAPNAASVKTFRRSKMEVLCLAICGAGMAAGSYGLISGGDAQSGTATHSWFSTFGVIFFGLCLIVFIVMLVLGSPRLVLSPNGIQSRFLRIPLISWHDIQDATAGRFMSQEYVALHLRDLDKYVRQMPRRARFGAATNSKLGIPPFSLMPDMFGTTTDNLIAEVKARIAGYGSKPQETE